MQMNLPTNPTAKHVLVDFENVCDIDTTMLESKNVTFTLLLGAGQDKLNVALVEQLLLHAPSVQLVRLTSRGKNALDFALAYYLGHAVASAPQTSFHIVSKDTGFDPLIEHLQSRQIRISRHNDFTDLTASTMPQAGASPKPKVASKAKTAPSNGDATDHALTQLRKVSANRPKSRKSLLSFLTSHLGTDMTETGAATVIESLSKAGNLAIDTKGAVTYALEQ
jgi:hypothetical protein